MPADQMEMTRRALIAEDKGFISHEDLSVIADGTHSAEDMKQMLKDAMQTVSKPEQKSTEKQAIDKELKPASKAKTGKNLPIRTAKAVRAY